MTNGKSDILRNLLVESINSVVSAGRVDLNSQLDVEGELTADIHGYTTIIEWNGIGHGELSFHVFWAIDAQAKGGKTLKRFSGQTITYYASVSGWLERKDGKWVQGEGGSSLSETYLSEFARSRLSDLSADGSGFKASGPDRFF
ncbi:hypothetical protein BM528_15660 [Alteromonas sp. RW2A1]|uniref:hypothetical protein n=1 Tax=Alteromonas sp. RW2A1 TaxID=1917158 RepID=UPI0009045699|nr:hypothetical protein [Alteromonas sp. RW2A1]APE07038.1 hypothetical protein BM528_15660 [Alteromonas sp. RW2A1]